MASELGVQTIQHTNGTDALTIDSSGRVSMPKRPYATVMFTQNATYVTKSAGSVIDFDTIFEQEGSNYNTSTYKYTAPLDGLYRVSVSVLTQYDNDKFQVDFYKNSDVMFVAYSVYRTMQASTFFQASAGDELYLIASTAANYWEGSNGNSRYCYATYMFMG